jgi:hypothetical protein
VVLALAFGSEALLLHLPTNALQNVGPRKVRLCLMGVQQIDRLSRPDTVFAHRLWPELLRHPEKLPGEHLRHEPTALLRHLSVEPCHALRRNEAIDHGAHATASITATGAGWFPKLHENIGL